MPSRVTDASRNTPATSDRDLELPGGVLKQGASGEGVRGVQQALLQLGHLTQEKYSTGPGKFGPATKAALQSFQRQWQLEADGVYGPKTRAALLKALDGVKPPAAPGPQPSPNVVSPSSGEPLRGLYNTDRFNKTVALTFDDGPHPVNTPKVLDVLKQFGVKATFFVTGVNAQKYPELIKRIVAEGHTIGHHSWDHADLRTRGPAQIRAELQRTQEAVEAALGRPYPIDQFRPPYGAMNEGVKSAVRAEQDVAVLWNVDSVDWKYRNDDARILRNVFEGSHSVYARGGVVLFHDIHPQTVRVLDDVIERLQREGFQIEKTDRLIGEKYAPPPVS